MKIYTTSFTLVKLLFQLTLVSNIYEKYGTPNKSEQTAMNQTWAQLFKASLA